MTEQHNHPFIMAHQSSSTESDNQVPPYPFEFDLKSSPQSSKDSMLQQEQETPFNLKGVTQSPSASKTLVCNKEETELQELLAEDSGREKLKRHRVEVAGRVWIPDMWGQEDLLKDWIDCSAFDAPLVPSKITMAREALVGEGRRANAAGLRIENRC
uniref:Protein BIC1 n=1 Tax=Lotus japonicus TaxID=34305 RepID=I3SWU1_LOTJA|nr:unknown [Lotus japonicus]